jgi:purine-nucleoside/S-methyl-5'-thioadenosine phosphorylase / adenosine deaminase
MVAAESGPPALERASELERRIDSRALLRLAARNVGGLTLLEARLPRPFRAAFTTRIGGESGDSFASLNLDLRSGDDPRAVTRNRTLLAEALGEMSGGQAPYRLVSPSQAHGLRVVGAAEYSCDQEGSPCDGLTIHPLIDRGLAALLLFADCVPIVLVGEVDMAVVHGGWRGILGGIVQQAARAMTGPPATAVIGPSIGPCCFEVGDGVAEAFAGRFGSDVLAETRSAQHPRSGDRARSQERSRPADGSRRADPSGPEAALSPSTSVPNPGAYGDERSGAHFRVDLWAATTKALVESGVNEGHIVNPRLCTVCNADLFYSHRAQGPTTGRHGCIAWTGLV